MILQEKYDLVDELLNIFEKLIEIYTNFKVLYNAKQRVLATDNLKDLQMLVQQEEEIVSVITALEERRIILQSRIDPSHKSVNQLIALLEGPRKERAVSLVEDLRKAVKLTSVMQDANSIALHNLLNLVKHKRNVLYKVSTVPEYGGNCSFANNSSIFNKII